MGRSRADLLLLLVTVIAAFGWMFSKEALGSFAPLQFMGIRFTLAATLVAAVGWKALRNLPLASVRQAGQLAIIFALAMTAWIFGLQHASSVGEGAFINSLGVVLVPLVARTLFGEKLSVSAWLAFPVAVAGLALLSLGNGFQPELGQLFFLVSAALTAIYINLTARVVTKVPAIALTAIQLAMAGAVTLILSLLLEDWSAPIAPVGWGWLLASAIVATSLRFFVQVYAQGLVAASHVAIIMTLEPVWAAILASLWLDEAMSPRQLVGCAFIFVALLVNRLPWIRRVLFPAR